MNTNVIILSFDSLPLSLLGCYGNEWVLTPHLDQLAWDGATFDNCFATDVSLEGRQQAWWTGNAIDAEPKKRADAQTQFLFRFLETLPTTLLSEPASASATPKKKLVRPSKNIRSSPFKRLLQHGLASAREMAERSKSSLLWLKYDGLSEPFDPPREYLELYLDEADELPDDQRSFDLIRAAAEVSYIDHLFGYFRKQIEELHGGLKPIWILTAATSRPVGFEPAEQKALHRMAEGYIHTPLLISHSSPGARRHQLVQTIDLLPTLCDLLNVNWDLPLEGKSLVPLLNDASLPGREQLILYESGQPKAVRSRSEFLVTRAADDRDRALIGEDRFGQDILLYRKPEDRWEEHDVSRMEPDLTAKLLQQISPTLR